MVIDFIAESPNSRNDSSALNDSDQQGNNRQDQQDVDESTHSIGSDQSENPQHQQNYKNCPEHLVLLADRFELRSRESPGDILVLGFRRMRAAARARQKVDERPDSRGRGFHFHFPKAILDNENFSVCSLMHSPKSNGDISAQLKIGYRR